jgi:ankyrin repeat protein
LWKHLQKKHQSILHDLTSTKTLREYYEESINEESHSLDELDLQLLEAVDRGETEKVRDILSRGANLSVMDRDRKTPFHLAIAKGNVAIVKVLCAHGADGNSGLCKAVDYHQQEVARFLIENGADIDREGEGKWEGYRRTPLHIAAGGDQEMTSLLLELGADPNVAQSGARGETALHSAVRTSEVITRLLLKGKADVNAKDFIGHTPLSYSMGIESSTLSYRSFIEGTTRILLEAGATVEPRHWDATPLGCHAPMVSGAESSTCFNRLLSIAGQNRR